MPWREMFAGGDQQDAKRLLETIEERELTRWVGLTRGPDLFRAKRTGVILPDIDVHIFQLIDACLHDRSRLSFRTRSADHHDGVNTPRQEGRARLARSPGALVRELPIASAVATGA